MSSNIRSMNNSNEVKCNQGQREYKVDIGGNITKIDISLCSVAEKRIVIHKSFVFSCVFYMCVI